jgi:Holliday junction resolvase RusA-like endonuclease
VSAAPIKLTIEGEPIPKARPRMVRGRIYTPTHDAENAAALVMRSSGYAGRFAASRSLQVSMFFYGAKKQADIDNLGKLYLDALVKSGIVKDDRYVMALWLQRMPDDGEPRVEVMVGEWRG